VILAQAEGIEEDMVDHPLLNNRYQLIEQIGAGGMAVIYKAQDLELARLVAVKVLRPSLISDPEFLMRFRREARAAANLSHPNIVTVHDVGQDGRTHYMVMEYAPGQDLKKLIQARGPLDVDTALAITIEICKGVGYAHRAGLVHCDIKPQNVLITNDKRVKVTDFGIARALSAEQTQEAGNVVWGSPHYFSPEQAAGEPPTPASDVYSIGIMLFELLTARLPFSGKDYRELALAHLRQPPPSIRDVDPSLPSELDGIIRKVLSKEPSARYRAADQLGRILLNYREQGLQPTSQFIMPSTVTPRQDIQPPDSTPTEPAIATEPSAPFSGAKSAMRRLRRTEAPQTSRQAAPPPAPAVSQPPPAPVYAPPPIEYGPAVVEEPGTDWFGIGLGILAAIAVLGLIPLWIAIFMTFMR
jgi:serine/threonine protein kinase